MKQLRPPAFVTRLVFRSCWVELRLRRMGINAGPPSSAGPRSRRKMRLLVTGD
jgi:hypothetical protein